ncbi:hypothetical protein [Mucilaginibacter lappiensis]|uniref:Uncharacterized protein n=1 Tax=Mucilaginibacter lappiensis TaxID=354630 RepID=A0A841JTB0_9SPHI|nr:hypothetical protein [Mucilaginibacter lappiensis]MBB6131515.1 hypothetical protein [Mucilaginibacter lappiensis]
MEPKKVHWINEPEGEEWCSEVSLIQYLVHTKDEHEKSAINIYVEHYGDEAKGLLCFLFELHLSRLSLLDFVTRINKQGTVNSIKNSDATGASEE